MAHCDSSHRLKYEALLQGEGWSHPGPPPEVMPTTTPPRTAGPPASLLQTAFSPLARPAQNLPVVSKGAPGSL